MDESDKSAIIAVIIYVIVLTLFIYFVIKRINYVEEVGLKIIFESIWEGSG